MLQTATILLALTALGGLLMAGIRFATRRNPPAWLAMLHGLLAASGLTLLVYAAFTQLVVPLANGHLSVAISPEADAPRVADLVLASLRG